MNLPTPPDRPAAALVAYVCQRLGLTPPRPEVPATATLLRMMDAAVARIEALEAARSN